MVRRLKWIGLSILLPSVVLFGLVVSPKARAVDFTQLVQYIGQWSITHAPSGSGTCLPHSGSWGYVNNTGTSPCGWTDNIKSIGGIGFNDRYIFQIDYFYYDLRDKEELNSYFTGSPTITLYSSGGWSTKYYGMESQMISNDSGYISIYFGINGSGSFNAGDYINVSTGSALNVNEVVGLPDKMTIWSLYSVSSTGGGTTNITEIVNAINNIRNSDESWYVGFATKMDNIYSAIRGNSQNIQNIDNSVQNIENNFEQQQQQAEQDGQQSQDDSNQSGQDVEASTTNILSAITGFFGAFTSATATNCQTDWGIEGFRNFDFCGTQIPTALRVVFTIVASIIFIPMIWFLINSILSAFKEFQQ